MSHQNDHNREIARQIAADLQHPASQEGPFPELTADARLRCVQPDTPVALDALQAAAERAATGNTAPLYPRGDNMTGHKEPHPRKKRAAAASDLGLNVSEGSGIPAITDNVREAAANGEPVADVVKRRGGGGGPEIGGAKTTDPRTPPAKTWTGDDQ